MSQPSSSSSPQNSQPSDTPEASRRLLTPEERFGLESGETGDAPPVNDPFVPEPPLAVRRREDEMARRHLPPHERRKHERNLRKRAKRESQYRAPRERVPHEQRAEAEREFAQQARTAPPVAPVKKQRRRVPVALKRLFALVCILFVGQLVFAAFTAPQFEIKSVAINGSSTTPPEQLKPLAVRLVGQNILRADRKAVEKAVEALPTVASAHVRPLLAWPPKSELRIVERQPVIKVGAGDDWWVADSHGVTFRRPAPEDEALYSVVAPQFEPRLSQPLDAKVWKRVAALNSAILKDNRIAATSPDATLVNTSAATAETDGTQAANAIEGAFWQLRRIYFDKNGLASLRFRGIGTLASQNEVLVRLGDDRWSEKLARARVALNYFQRTGRRAAELDLVSLERPVWLPVPTQLAAQKPEDEEAGQSG
jgi:cell division septal protein FtsQ